MTDESSQAKPDKLIQHPADGQSYIEFFREFSAKSMFRLLDSHIEGEPCVPLLCLQPRHGFDGFLSASL
jgi:hypothetical protein